MPAGAMAELVGRCGGRRGAGAPRRGSRQAPDGVGPSAVRRAHSGRGRARGRHRRSARAGGGARGVPVGAGQGGPGAGPRRCRFPDPAAAGNATPVRTGRGGSGNGAGKSRRRAGGGRDVGGEASRRPCRQRADAGAAPGPCRCPGRLRSIGVRGGFTDDASGRAHRSRLMWPVRRGLEDISQPAGSTSRGGGLPNSFRPAAARSRPLTPSHSPLGRRVVPGALDARPSLWPRHAVVPSTAAWPAAGLPPCCGRKSSLQSREILAGRASSDESRRGDRACRLIRLLSLKVASALGRDMADAMACGSPRCSHDTVTARSARVGSPAMSAPRNPRAPGRSGHTGRNHRAPRKGLSGSGRLAPCRPARTQDASSWVKRGGRLSENPRMQARRLAAIT